MSSDFTQQLTALTQNLDSVMNRDRFSLTRKINDVRRKLKEGKPVETSLTKLQKSFEASVKLLQKRQQALPDIEFPESLPVSARREEITKLIEQHQVVILAGETGSGKTTQLPKICMAMGRGVKGIIGHTQPRRIAARTVASRIAEELKSPLGESVGYQVRFTDHSRDTSHVKLMTDGILLAEIQHDRYLNKYDTLIIDEAHERSLNIDFLLGYIKQILPRRPDLKVIITSATIDLKRFSEHFNDAPIIEVSGRTFPVDVKYRPTADLDGEPSDAIVHAVEEILDSEQGGKRGGDILVFLSGEREIREAALALRRANLPHTEVLPLYARLSLDEQNKVFAGHRGRRVVLATNVAETSITVPGIRYVIDPGFARISRYSYRSKIQRLPVEPVSQASANQRMGRCGRVSEGICYRLYSEDDFVSRPAFTDAEIQRTNLAAVILQMLNLRIGDIRHFPFVDNPDQRLINDGFKLLQELQAVNQSGQLTALGRQLMTLPVDPKLGRMVLAADKLNCLNELMIIVSGMSIQDPRERPAEKKQAADEKHRRFKDDHSDFMAYINLWNYAEEQRQALSQNQFRKLCKREYLSFLRLREWKEIHHQLRLALKPMKFNVNSEPAGYESVHRALINGLLGQIGRKDEDREYLGVRNRRFFIFPGSALVKKSPKWLISGQLLETSKVFAHQVAKVEPNWILDAAKHLVKRHQFEPHYHVKSGQVMAYERVSLYGLPLVEKQRVSYGSIDPVVSRQVFIRAAFVESMYRGKGRFFKLNTQLVKELHGLEAKSRRRDILVDEEAIYRFYDERVPDNVVNLAGFERWRKTVEQAQPKLLSMTREQLMQHDASAITEAQFPNVLAWEGMSFPLSYHFEPNHPEDGVSIKVPVAALHLLPENFLQWSIPGILRDKCIALVKGLPKQWRKNFVPVPSFVDKALAALSPDDVPLTEALTHQLKRLTLVEVPADQWQIQSLDDYYRFNIQVVGPKGEVLAQSRNLTELRDRYRDQLKQTLQSKDTGHERDDITVWDFELPATVNLKRAGMTITAYPALMDKGDRLSLRLQDNPIEAQVFTQRGLVKLAQLALAPKIKYLRKELLKGKDLGLTVVNLGRREQVADGIIFAAIAKSCFNDFSDQGINELPRSKVQFEQCLAAGTPELITTAQMLEGIVIKVLASVVAIKKAIKGNKNALAIAIAAGDINRQLERLIYPDFLYEVPLQWLQQYPRYMRAIELRLEKVTTQIQKDKVWTAEIEALQLRWDQRLEKEGTTLVMANAALQHYRWMLEEYRVSLFAQSLKTCMPVSEKRLNKAWQEAK